MKDLFEVLKPGSKDWALANTIDPNRLPAHIAIIMDGNGRWARRRNLPRVAGHKAGVEAGSNHGGDLHPAGDSSAHAVRVLGGELEAAARRSRHAVAAAARVPAPRASRDLLSNGIRFTLHRPSGCASAASARRSCRIAIDATAHNPGMRLNLAINYSGRAELVDAVNAIVEDARLEGRLRDLRIDEEAIAARLYTAGLPDPDLLIRTSGEMRISNFLLWQIAYAELYVTETLWPDFRRADLLHAILDYQKRDRRFGGLSPEGERVRPGRVGGSGRHNRAMTRILTALLLIPFFCYIVLWAPQWAFLAVVAAVAVLCFHEYAELAALHKIPKPGLFGYVAGLLVLLLPEKTARSLYWSRFSQWRWLCDRSELAQVLPERRGIAAGCGVRLRFAALRDRFARHQSVLAVLRTVAQLGRRHRRALCGTTSGRHKLAPRVSPAKSWEGAAGSLVASVIYGAMYIPRLLPAVPLAEGVGLEPSPISPASWATCANRLSNAARALKIAEHCCPDTAAGWIAWIAVYSRCPWFILWSAISTGDIAQFRISIANPAQVFTPFSPKISNVLFGKVRLCSNALVKDWIAWITCPSPNCPL